jgi:hypothetical protein
VKRTRRKTNDMEKEQLCPKCKSDYLKLRDEPR